ncbi:hypothetical protein V6N13_084199 [Hibiscus sabdariffa]|uniref:Protein kinase domain-containing protein n=1 Tax=Hibiscus sabdariffa TaxID=183260 RepID=A0ABR2T0B5_9ROSI
MPDKAIPSLANVNVTSHVEHDWPAGLKIVPVIARGLDYLHIELSSLEVSHGNLESSNVLLGPDNHPFLSDYGYRRDRSPVCIHDSGKVSPKSDVYCVGIIILKILTGKFPSQYLSHKEDETDVVQLTEPALSERIQDELLGLEITDTQNSSLCNMERLLQYSLALHSNLS